MATQRPVDERLAAAKALAGAPAAADLGERIAAALADRDGLVVGAGAAAALAHRRADLVPALRAALDRLYQRLPGSDRRCVGKLALIDALDGLGHDDEADWLRAAAHRQPEPTWGRPEDTAGPLRLRAVQALIDHHHPQRYRVLVDLLADPLPRVRCGAAQLLGQLGDERAILVLRLKARSGDAEAEVVADALAALVAADPGGSADIALGFLRAEDAVLAHAAALALGGARLERALAPLLDALDRARDDIDRQAYATAVALLRSDEAMRALIDRLDRRPLAAAVADALAPYRARPDVAAALDGR